MNSSDFQLRGVGDPRLAVHATSPLPAWLWSSDGTRVLWANPVGARLFGVANAADLARKTFGPADPHRRQVVQLGRRLAANGALRLERLRGFGAAPGMLMTCGCARLAFSDGSHGVLVTAVGATGRSMPLVERLQRLVEGVNMPMAAFAPDGMFIGASEAARPLLGFRDLAEAGLDQARNEALQRGRVETSIGIGHMVLQRVGTGADIGLVALLAPVPTPAEHVAHGPPVEPAEAAETCSTREAPPEPAIPDYEQPALSNEAPAEFALLDTSGEADETSVRPVAPEPVAPEPAVPAPQQPEAPQPPPVPRTHPLRFLWQADADEPFVLRSEEFIRLIGPRTAAAFNRPWRELAQDLAIDPEGRVAEALATRNTWAGITVTWPADNDEGLPVELAGLPIYDEMRNFAGFRGFGVCRDLDALNRLEALRRFESSAAASPPRHLAADAAESVESEASPEHPPPAGADAAASAAELPEPPADANSPSNDLDKAVETPPNVVPFRPLAETKSPALTPVENSAFNELARQLSERLERDNDAAAEGATGPETAEAAAEGDIALPPPEQADVSAPEWLSEPAPPPRGDSIRDRTLLDLLPSGILIYRLDRLLYANAAFLSRIGYPSLHALEDAGGLDALYIEPGVSSASSTSEAGTPVTISAGDASQNEAAAGATEAHLHTIEWDGESALALICSPPASSPAAETRTEKLQPSEPEAPPMEQAELTEAGHANAEDLAAILDTTAEGIIMFDAEGNIYACNRSAEALFGYAGEELVRHNLTTLFAPESRAVVADYLHSLKSQGIGSLLDHGREVLGRESKGGLIPLAMTMGRTRPDGPNFFAVFREVSTKKSSGELERAQRIADRAASAKADMLARISHELRTPLNAILGFAEVMIGERFGALGNERYVEYMKDIRASGERVISIIDDLLELSRIETGKLDLCFTNLNLNDLVESCVVVMQPQANRERIIIRTSLAHALPPVHADARALRQIAMNLVGNSIHLASAGGQVIVSTALTDAGEVVLRIRDTGHGLSEKEVAAAMEPFRTPPPSDNSDSAGLSLSLTRALVEANRGRFNIKTGTNSGTLIEVVFSPALARA